VYKLSAAILPSVSSRRDEEVTGIAWIEQPGDVHAHAKHVSPSSENVQLCVSRAQLAVAAAASAKPCDSTVSFWKLACDIRFGKPHEGVFF
jgi:hypothetical protein